MKQLKRYLAQYPRLYIVLRFFYDLRPAGRWKRAREEQFRGRCYAEFARGQRAVEITVGRIAARFEAISPKNYWHLRIGGEHEDKWMGRVIQQYVRPGDVVLDIGASTGLYTVPLAKAVGERGVIYAFEPEPVARAATVHNAQLNGLKNTVVLGIAVSDKMGQSDFFVRPDKDTHSIFEQTTAPSPLGIQEKFTVDTASVDGLVADGRIKQPDFIKIDVEGAELAVLDGMRKAASRVRAVLVEIHGTLILHGYAEPRVPVEARLRALGFTQLKYLDEYHVVASRGQRV